MKKEFKISVGDKMKFNKESDIVICSEVSEDGKSVKSKNGQWYDMEGTILVEKSPPKEETPKELWSGGEWWAHDNIVMTNIKPEGDPQPNTWHVVQCWSPSARSKHQNGTEEAKANALICAQAKNMYKALQEFVEDGDTERQAEYYKGLFRELLQKANPSL